MSFKKSNWGWSRTGHPTYLELNALFWQVGDFGLVAAILAMQEKSQISLLVNEQWSCWTVGIKTGIFLSLELWTKRGKWLSHEEVHAFKSSAGEVVSFLYRRLHSKPGEKQDCPDPPPPTRIIHFSVLTFVNPMLRFSFNIDQILINQY